MSGQSDFPCSGSASLSEMIEFIRRAGRQPGRQAALASALQRLIDFPGKLDRLISRASPELDENGEALLFEDDSLSVWLCHFSPHLSIPPHNHKMAALIGLYEGRERHEIWTVRPDGSLQPKEAILLEAGQILQLDADMVHNVACHDNSVCKGLHIYLGALTKAERHFYEQGQHRPISQMRFLPRQDSDIG